MRWCHQPFNRPKYPMIWSVKSSPNIQLFGSLQVAQISTDLVRWKRPQHTIFATQCPKGGVISRFHKRGSRMHLGDPFGSLKDRSTNITPHFGILGLPGPKNGQKRPKSGQKQGKARFWASDGPKWLDQCGSKVDLVLGRPNWPSWTSFGIQLTNLNQFWNSGYPQFGAEGPKTAQIWPKMLPLS